MRHLYWNTLYYYIQPVNLKTDELTRQRKNLTYRMWNNASIWLVVFVENLFAIDGLCWSSCLRFDGSQLSDEAEAKFVIGRKLQRVISRYQGYKFLTVVHIVLYHNYWHTRDNLGCPKITNFVNNFVPLINFQDYFSDIFTISFQLIY